MKEKKTSEKQASAKYSVDELCDILDQALKTYMASRYISYYMHIRTFMPNIISIIEYFKYYRITVDPRFEGIQQRLTVFKEFQEEKVLQNGLNGTYNGGVSQFVLKAQHRYIERKEREKLQIERDKLDKGVIDPADLKIEVSVVPVKNENTYADAN